LFSFKAAFSVLKPGDCNHGYYTIEREKGRRGEGERGRGGEGERGRGGEGENGRGGERERVSLSPVLFVSLS
jgi:hypothetical protein